MNLIDITKAIQRHVGAEADGVFGPATARKVWEELQRMLSDGPDAPLKEDVLDARTLDAIGSLDPKARDRFTRFVLLAKATAATMGCDYVAISGFRTWEEQDKLFAQRPRVTKAAGGYSWHNFGVAADFAVFYGKAYADESNPALAERVHSACAAHAEACGLEWGGSWKSFPDQPHYQIDIGHASPTAADRELFNKKSSIL